VESFIALLVAVTLVLSFIRRERLALGFFACSVVLLVILLRLHATDALKLNF